MKYLVYKSSANIKPTSKEHDAILISSFQNNKSSDITGFLLRKGNFFIQYLEGPTSAVDVLVQTLKNDWRHSHLHIFDEGELKQRALGAWQMAFVSDPNSQLDDILDLSNDDIAIKSNMPFDLVNYLVAHENTFLRTSAE